MKILICASGTGGHIYPALDMAGYFKQQGTEVYFICEKNCKFIEEIADAKQNLFLDGFFEIDSKAFSGMDMKSKLISIFKNLKGLFQAIKIVKNCNTVIGFGGYIQAPVLTAAIILRKPYYIHEANSIPGRANLFFAKFAKKIFISFKGTEGYFKNRKKIIYTGLPVRQSITDYNDKKYSLNTEKKIIIYGGSNGAKILCDYFLEIYNKLSEKNIGILLVTGRQNYEYVLNNISEAKIDESRIKIFPYIKNLKNILHNFDLAITRAGAGTCFELLKNRLPGILIPFPFAIDDHQKKNACELVKTGGYLMIEQNKLDSESLFNLIIDIFENKIYQQMKEKLLDYEIEDEYKKFLNVFNA